MILRSTPNIYISAYQKEATAYRRQCWISGWTTSRYIYVSTTITWIRVIEALKVLTSNLQFDSFSSPSSSLTIELSYSNNALWEKTGNDLTIISGRACTIAFLWDSRSSRASSIADNWFSNSSVSSWLSFSFEVGCKIRLLRRSWEPSVSKIAKFSSSGSWVDCNVERETTTGKGNIALETKDGMVIYSLKDMYLLVSAGRRFRGGWGQVFRLGILDREQVPECERERVFLDGAIFAFLVGGGPWLHDSGFLIYNNLARSLFSAKW